MKVAIIGAGSIVFCRALALDILATPGLQDTEFALMAPGTRRTPHTPVDPALAIVARFEELGGESR